MKETPSDMIMNNTILIAPFIKAKKTFDDALGQAKSRLEKDGVIQRFEYSYELSWKLLKRVLAFKGIEVNSPRDVFREAAREGLIEDPELWFEFLKKRNLTVHTYNEEVAEDIFSILPSFKDAIDKLLIKLQSL